jgi:hypothetical protein
VWSALNVLLIFSVMLFWCRSYIFERLINCSVLTILPCMLAAKSMWSVLCDILNFKNWIGKYERRVSELHCGGGGGGGNASKHALLPRIIDRYLHFWCSCSSLAYFTSKNCKLKLFLDSCCCTSTHITLKEHCVTHVVTCVFTAGLNSWSLCGFCRFLYGAT